MNGKLCLVTGATSGIGFAAAQRRVIRHGADLLRAFTAARSRRVSVILRKAYGGAFITMNSKDIGATASFAWPGAEIGIMGPRAAVEIIHRRELVGSTAPERDASRLARSYADAHLSSQAAPGPGRGRRGHPAGRHPSAGDGRPLCLGLVQRLRAGGPPWRERARGTRGLRRLAARPFLPCLGEDPSAARVAARSSGASPARDPARALTRWVARPSTGYAPRMGSFMGPRARGGRVQVRGCGCCLPIPLALTVSCGMLLYGLVRSSS